MVSDYAIYAVYFIVFLLLVIIIYLRRIVESIDALAQQVGEVEAAVGALESHFQQNTPEDWDDEP